MKITLAFVNAGPGKGEIRARVYGPETETLTVGDYRRRQQEGDWIARLWAVPGDPEAVALDGLIYGYTVTRLSNAAAARGKWWT